MNRLVTAKSDSKVGRSGQISTVLAMNDRSNVSEPTSLNWTTWSEALRVITYRRYLKKTVSTALLVGFVLFAINHLDEVLRGQVTPVVWVKVLTTFLVPFLVSNVGILIATRSKSNTN